MWILLRLLLLALKMTAATRRDLVLENLALRHQLAVCLRSRPPQIHNRDRRFWSALARGWSGWRETLLFVQPATVVRWHHTAWQRYRRWKSRHRGPGRPRISPEVQALIGQMATENPRWGAIRIVSELQALGIEVSASTVRAYRRQALRRPPSPTWSTLLRLHAHEIWASDFFTVPTLTFRTLYVFVMLSHDRRRIVHVNVTAHPIAPWVYRQIIQATHEGTAPRFLIRDRSYGRDFVSRAALVGIEALLTPVQAPRANSLAERAIGTIRHECTDHIIVLNEQHLRRVLRDYATYYNEARPHRSLAPEPPARLRALPPTSPRRHLVSDPALGGLHHVQQMGRLGPDGVFVPHRRSTSPKSDVDGPTLPMRCRWRQTGRQRAGLAPSS